MLFFFFFASRRRHTRLQGDWSSDVCSSDLRAAAPAAARPAGPSGPAAHRRFASGSEERRVGKSVDLGGRRIIKKKKTTKTKTTNKIRRKIKNKFKHITTKKQN